MKVEKSTPKKEAAGQQKTTAAKAKKDLAQQIAFFHKMNQLAQARARFTDVKDELNELKFENAADLDSFENNTNFKLVLKAGYNNEVLSVSNDFLLNEFKTFMLAKIDAKIGQIDAELIK